MSDIALSKNSMMFVTQEGEGFSGVWAGEYRKSEEKKGEAIDSISPNHEAVSLLQDAYDFVNQ